MDDQKLINFLLEKYKRKSNSFKDKLRNSWKFRNAIFNIDRENLLREKSPCDDFDYNYGKINKNYCMNCEKHKREHKEIK